VSALLIMSNSSIWARTTRLEQRSL
jgi:hypothetical protein